MTETTTEAAQKPFKQFRRGAVSVAVWKREHNGHTYYSATPTRAFTRDEGTTFEYTTTFSADDIPIVVSLMTLAFQFIVATESADAQRR